MEQFTLEQRIEILKTYFQNRCNIAETVRILKRNFGQNNAPTGPCISEFIKKVREIGVLVDKPNYSRIRPLHSSENIETAEDSERIIPTSTNGNSHLFDIGRTTLRRILHKDLGLFPYKIQLTQKLKPKDHSLRYNFSVWALEQLERDVDFAKKIIFSNEAHFHLGGYVVKHNCRIWGSEEPRTPTEKPEHPDHVTAWCGFWAGGIIGPFFFENDGNSTATNEERYKDMLSNFFHFIHIEELDGSQLWFQQDGPKWHTSRPIMHLLSTKFGNRVISRFGDISWPPRSCDLTPLDFFVWGAVKDRCYADNPATIQALKYNIVRAVAEISTETIGNVVQNWIDRIGYCKASRGSHLSEISFQ